MSQPSEQNTSSPDDIGPLLRSVLTPAYNFALRLTHDPADADDLLQEAALRACQHFHQFTPGTNFRAWIFRIMANCYKNGLRYQSRRGQPVSLEDAPPLHLFIQSAEVGFHDIESDPAAALLARLGIDQVMEALDELPEEYRTVATLYFVEDFTYAEIAEVLEIPAGTVRSRLHRGRKLLQRALWDLAVESGVVAGVRSE